MAASGRFVKHVICTCYNVLQCFTTMLPCLTMLQWHCGFKTAPCPGLIESACPDAIRVLGLNQDLFPCNQTLLRFLAFIRARIQVFSQDSGYLSGPPCFHPGSLVSIRARIQVFSQDSGYLSGPPCFYPGSLVSIRARTSI